MSSRRFSRTEIEQIVIMFRLHLYNNGFFYGAYAIQNLMKREAIFPLLIITLSHNYSWKYLQNLRTNDIKVGGIKRKGIDLDKSTKPYKETEQTVCESHRICLLVGKEVGRFSSPTLINSRRFGNTKKPSFRI